MKTAFIDRDGTIIENTGFVNTVEDLLAKRFTIGAISGMKSLRARGYQLVIVSNQSVVGIGVITEATLREINAALLGRLGEHGIYVRNFRYCPHAPEAGCACRKPMPGMLLDSALEDGAELSQSIMIGDQECDMEAGKRAGVKRTILVPSSGSWQELYTPGVAL